MTDDLKALAARRDRLWCWSKALLLAALVAFLAAMASGHETTSGTLLNGRASYLALVLDIPVQDQRYIWGGPATLFGLQAATYSISAIGIARIIWLRLVRGRWSPLGFALWLCPPIIGLTALSDITATIHPATLDQGAVDRLVAAIDQRRPGLVARLRAGERPGFRDLRGTQVTVDDNGVHRQFGVPVEKLLLDDRGTIEGLRFALAEQATTERDKAGLLRLLPLDLPRKPVDLPARNAFAHRMEAMERLAGGPVVAESDRAELAKRQAAWRCLLDIAAVVRPVMQIVFLLGAAAGLFAWRLRRRIVRLERAGITLSAPPPDGPQDSRPQFGRRVRMPTHPAPR